MSHYQAAATHHHSSLNSIPQTHHPALPTSLVAPIKRENDSDDDDVVFLATVPKVEHTPKEYDPECKCSTCRLVKKLLGECTCEECKSTGQAGHSIESVTIPKEAIRPNSQPSKSSIQNNDTSKSGQLSVNDNDDRESRSSTPDYLPRFFDDESGDSSSDDNEDDDHIDDADSEGDKEPEQESENDDSSDSDYAFSRPSTSKSLKRNKRSTKHGKTINLEKSHKCPRCDRRFTKKQNLRRHYRVIHQQLKPYYCKWTKCDFVSGRHDKVIDHITVNHFKHRKNVIQAKVYVGKRKLDHSKDPLLESSLRFVRFACQAVCPKCKRNLPSESHLEVHLGTHKKDGFCCTWAKCGFFFAKLSTAKEHVCADHLQVETINAQQTNQHLVKVNSRTGKTCKVKVRPNRSLNASDNSRPSTSGSRLASVSSDDKSSYSSGIESDDSDNDTDNFDRGKTGVHSSQVNSFNCPKCETSFIKKSKLLRHYRGLHLESKPFYCKWPGCNFAAGIHDYVVHHANRKHFNWNNRKQARSCVGIRKASAQKDPIYESIRMMALPERDRKGEKSTK